MVLNHGDRYEVDWANGAMQQIYYKGYNLYSDIERSNAYGNHVEMRSSNPDVVKVSWSRRYQCSPSVL